MDVDLRNEILDRVRTNPLIAAAAVVGSNAKGKHEDAFSDLDLLIIANDVNPFLTSKAWLPRSSTILLHEVHLARVVSVLWNSLQKLDATIYEANQPATDLIVLDYSVIKGGESFSKKLEIAVGETKKRAPHLGPNVSLGNVLLLLVTAHKRLQREENLSAHQFLAAACDMTLFYERRKRGLREDADDLLDPRRRLERNRATTAKAMQDSLFRTPKDGIRALAEYIQSTFSDELTPEHLFVLQHLT